MYPSSEIAVLKTDHHPIIKRDWKTPAWKAARATSAAPTYFQGLQHGEKVFADGGMWGNNPVMLAVLEAYSCFDISLDQIRVLSIGCGNPPVRFKRKSYLGGLITWAKAFDLSVFPTTGGWEGSRPANTDRHPRACREDPDLATPSPAQRLSRRRRGAAGPSEQVRG
jgi:patatin-like phospholipase/acyl hydrolase